jgi:hypothetical protein
LRRGRYDDDDDDDDDDNDNDADADAADADDDDDDDDDDGTTNANDDAAHPRRRWANNVVAESETTRERNLIAPQVYCRC